MLDPREGRTTEGMPVTGAGPERLRGRFRPVLDDAVRAVVEVAPDASVYVYGSVASGAAEVGRSDVDPVVARFATDIGLWA